MQTVPGQTCAKCGALLPDEDEGLCPSCGTPFGRATVALQVTGDMLKRAAMENAEQERRATQAHPPAPELPMPAAGGGGGLPLPAILAGAGAIIVLLLVLIWLLL